MPIQHPIRRPGRRKEVFAFTEKPVATRQGDRTPIAFAVKDFCDVAVAVEDQKGRILRHLASGVLGPTAPEPFQKNSLKQSIVWDGKDEKGEYVEDKEKVVVRVSLGLEPRFERTLFRSPHKMLQANMPLVVGSPEGVCVVDRMLDGLQARLFDHAGNYVRTIVIV